MEPNKNNDRHDHAGKKNNKARPNEKDSDDAAFASPDKYLAMEQPGVSYTSEKSHTSNSDYLEFDNDEQRSDKFRAHHQNSRNSDAFSQDDYILRDNLDLDEDQSNSISSDDAPDTNTTDETS